MLGKPLAELFALRALELPDGLTRVGSYWFAGSKVERVVVPASVQELGSWAFRSCGQLEEVVFQPGSRTRVIEAYCFIKSGLTRVEVPASVAVIEDGAFWGCKKLSKVVF